MRQIISINNKWIQKIKWSETYNLSRITIYSKVVKILSSFKKLMNLRDSWSIESPYKLIRDISLIKRRQDLHTIHHQLNLLKDLNNLHLRTSHL